MPVVTFCFTAELVSSSHSLAHFYSPIFMPFSSESPQHKNNWVSKIFDQVHFLSFRGSHVIGWLVGWKLRRNLLVN